MMCITSCHIVLVFIQPVHFCDFESPALIPYWELSGYYLVNLGGTTITAGVATKVEGVSLVCMAYSGAIAMVSYNVLFLYC